MILPVAASALKVLSATDTHFKEGGWGKIFSICYKRFKDTVSITKSTVVHSSLCRSVCISISTQNVFFFPTKVKDTMQGQHILKFISLQVGPRSGVVREQVDKKRILERRLCSPFRDNWLSTTELLYHGA